MKAAIMGFGTVGSGVYEVLDRNRETVRKKAGEPIEIKYILNRRDLPGSPVEDLVVHEIGTILEDPETGLVVETMGGTSPAYEYVKCCLQAGKHVVTSNKNLVAAHGTELLAIAREKRVSFLFEASVGGGIPIIRTINESLAGDVPGAGICRAESGGGYRGIRYLPEDRHPDSGGLRPGGGL